MMSFSDRVCNYPFLLAYILFDKRAKVLVLET